VKRLVWILVIIISVALAGAAWFIHSSRQKMARWQATLDEMRERAIAEHDEARARYAAGQSDLEIAVEDQFLEKLMTSLEGFESVNRFRTILRIDHLDPTLRTGYVFVEADATLTSPVYSGPVKATYYAFTELLPDGRCRLVFRIAEARPMGNNLLRDAWIEAWIVSTIQSQMRMPELTLPLGMARSFTLDAVTRKARRGEIDIHIPERTVALALEGGWVMVTPRFLGFFVDHIGIAGQPVPEQVRLPRQRAEPDGVSVSLRFDLLSEIIAELFRPGEDVFLSAEKVEGVYDKERKVLGKAISNRVDLEEVSGVVDLGGGRLHPETETLSLALTLDGDVAGRVKGKAYGIPFNQQFRVRAELDDRVPVSLRFEADALVLKPGQKDLPLLLQARVVLAGVGIPFKYRFLLDSEDLFRPLEIPLTLQREVAVPIKIRGKRVLEERKLSLDLSWRLTLPEGPEGRLIVHGDVEATTAE